jgi:putative transposase
MAALQRAIEERRPQPGLVHHSDRGVQYASGEYVAVLNRHQMIPSMSRPANPYDNASCESFMKTLKREEICASCYENLEQLRTNIEIFIDEYHNKLRLHSALGRRSPEEFEQQVECQTGTRIRRVRQSSTSIAWLTLLQGCRGRGLTWAGIWKSSGDYC